MKAIIIRKSQLIFLAVAFFFICRAKFIFALDIRPNSNLSAQHLNHGPIKSDLLFSNNACVNSTADSAASTIKKINIILVHGTFARGSTWYQPGGNFFQALQEWGENNGIELQLEPFRWTGALSALKRMEAATELLQMIINLQHQSSDPIIIIGHSHGANVAFLATQFLAALQQDCIAKQRMTLTELIDFGVLRELSFIEQLKLITVRSVADAQDYVLQDMQLDFSSEQVTQIKNKILHNLLALPIATRSLAPANCCPISMIFALGAPIDASVYWPAENIVKSVYSVYSEGDKVQIYSAQFKRRFAECLHFKPQKCNVVDLQITFRNDSKSKSLEHPKHLQLNNGVVGRWLLELPKLMEVVAPGINPSNSCHQAWFHFFKDLSKPVAKKI